MAGTFAASVVEVRGGSGAALDAGTGTAGAAEVAGTSEAAALAGADEVSADSEPFDEFGVVAMHLRNFCPPFNSLFFAVTQSSASFT